MNSEAMKSVVHIEGLNSEELFLRQRFAVTLIHYALCFLIMEVEATFSIYATMMQLLNQLVGIHTSAQDHVFTLNKVIDVLFFITALQMLRLFMI